MHLSKKVYLSSIGFMLCLALLVGVFLVVPHVTQAKAPYTPISITQPVNCTPMTGVTDNSLNYQLCSVAVSIKYNVSSGVHFSTSYSIKSCYATCITTYNKGAGVATPEGTSITQASTPIHVLLIAPYQEVHGGETITYTFSGPSNKVSVQVALPSMSE